MGSDVIDTVDGFVDTRRYPLDDPDDPAWHDVVARARAELRAQGATVLRDVVRPERRELLRAQGDEVAGAAHTEVARVNVYNTDPDDDLPDEHPARVVLQRRNAFVARDRIPAGHLVQRLYAHPGLHRLLAACFEVPAVHPLADPCAGLTLNVVAPGRRPPLALRHQRVHGQPAHPRAARAAAVFEYCPDIRAGRRREPRRGARRCSTATRRRWSAASSCAPVTCSCSAAATRCTA